MSIIEACLLGFLQGLTEFLPVSSSGHLVVVETLLHYQASSFLTFDLLLHLATLLAVCLFFRKRLRELGQAAFSPFTPSHQNDARMVAAILVSTFITCLIGLLFKDFFESIRDVLWGVGLSFMVTGGLLLATRRMKSEEETSDTGIPINLWTFAILMGVMQGLAIVPGISRSGATVCTALLLGVSKTKAVEYSFLMSIPAILIASGYQFIDSHSSFLSIGLGPALMGFCISLLSGIVFLCLLVWIVEKGRLYQFAFYTIPLGLVVFILALLGF